MLKNIYMLNNKEILALLINNEDINRDFTIFIQESTERVIKFVLADSDIENVNHSFIVEPLDFLSVRLEGITKQDCILVLISYFDGSMNELLSEKFDFLASDKDIKKDFKKIMRAIKSGDSQAITDFINTFNDCIDSICIDTFYELSDFEINKSAWTDFLDTAIPYKNNHCFMYADTDTNYVYNLKHMLFCGGVE